MSGEVKGVIFDYGGVISQPQNKDCIKIMLRLLNSNDPDLFEKVYNKYRQDYDLGILDGTSPALKMSDSTPFGIKTFQNSNKH